jgi:PAS domain S-box-containing protein
MMTTAEMADSPWLAAAFDAAPEMMMVVDAQGRLLFANARARQTFENSHTELGGNRFEVLLGPEDRAFFREDLLACLAGPSAASPIRQELIGIDHAGRRFPIEISLSHSGSSDVSVVVVLVRDLTAQRRQEKEQSAATAEARQARDWLEALLEFAPAFIIGLSKTGTIDFINRTLPQHAKKDVIGSSWRQYFQPDQQAHMVVEMEAMYATQATRTYETSTPGPDGADVWFECQIAPIRIGGRIVGAVLVSQDITERKRAHAELLAGRQMALLGTLAAGVAHEINTPIQFVGDSVQFLRGSAQDLLTLLDRLQDLRQVARDGMPLGEAIAAAQRAEEEADLPYIRENMPSAFDRCIDGLNRVTTIVRSLKDFAHPSEAQMVPADLNRAIETTLTIARNEYKYVADLRTEFGELPPVTCHAGEISQAVLNILVNAAHAIGDVVPGDGSKGLITVRTWREGDQAVISLSDTGGGIPERIRPRIFDPFFTTKEVGKGTGQGLAIARSTVKERHGGGLTFETEVGKGTTFFIRLPIDGAEPSA